MQVPRSLLPHKITTKAYLGSTSIGPTYGPARQRVRARVEPSRKVISTATGNDVVSAAKVTVRPADAVDAESEVVLDSTVAPLKAGTYTVGSLESGEGLRRPAYIDMYLVGPR